MNIGINTGYRAKTDPRFKADRLKDSGLIGFDQPWATVRDALHGLPDPADQKAAARHNNHVFQPGARV